MTTPTTPREELFLGNEPINKNSVISSNLPIVIKPVIESVKQTFRERFRAMYFPEGMQNPYILEDFIAKEIHLARLQEREALREQIKRIWEERYGNENMDYSEEKGFYESILALLSTERQR